MDELPHFLGIGAQKAASTWLYRCLRAHPRLWLPPIKELHYFTHRSEDSHAGIAGRLWGRDWVNRRLRRTMKPRLLSDLRSFDARRVRWDLLFFLGRRSDAWYQSLFRAGSSRVTGEITPEYALLSADEVGRVRDAFPHLRILYLMRDPIDRAWSNMRMLARLRGLSLDSEGVALTLAGDPMVVARGDYRGTLDAWSRHFPPDRIFTGFMEEVRSDPRALLTRIFDFLGVATDDSVLTPDLYRIVHGGAPKPIPAAVERELARTCIQDLRILEERFGHPVSAWRERAERVLAG
ncbi:MAG TPA: sulfotransferase [Gemmatimonadota bacterium]|nr:sulfotransferase [Gemmatimonadota bacterium]